MEGMVDESLNNDVYHAYQVAAHNGHLQRTMMVNAAAAAAAGHPHHVNVSNPYMLAPINGSMPINATRQLNVRRYPCKMCSAVFDSKTEYQMHFQSHMREPKPYKCSQCPKCFANSSYLSQHMRIHLGIKPYHCEVCKKRFTQLSHLQQHHRTHTGDKPYKCPHPGCTKAFSQLSNLQSHSRCHQSDKPFKCNSCYKCFFDEASLLEHIPKHKESKHLKTHICKFCGKSYTQETYLARHMAKHLDKMDHKSRLGDSASKTGDMFFPSKQESPSSDNSSGRMATEDFMGSFTGVGYTPYPSYGQMVDYSNAGAAAYEFMPATKANNSAFCIPSNRFAYGYESYAKGSHQMNGTMHPYDLHNGANRVPFGGLNTSVPTMLDANMRPVSMGNMKDGMGSKHLQRHQY